MATYETKKITIRQVIEAMEENGLLWLQDGNYIKYDGDNIPRAGCIIGQAAVNLGVAFTSLHYALPIITNANGESITQYNDEEAISYEDAVGYAKRLLADYLDDVIEVGAAEYYY